MTRIVRSHEALHSSHVWANLHITDHDRIHLWATIDEFALWVADPHSYPVMDRLSYWRGVPSISRPDITYVTPTVVHYTPDGLPIAFQHYFILPVSVTHRGFSFRCWSCMSDKYVTP